MHKFETKVRLHHTDALGIAYYSAIFVLAHECYESFLDIAAIFKEGRYIIPIVHAEADYKVPLELSDNIAIEMRLTNTGRSSFTLEYDLINQRAEIAAQVKTVHSVLDRKTRKPIEMPASIRERVGEI